MVLITDCPSKMIGCHASEVLNLVEWAKRGVLPNPGGYWDQPSGTLDAIEFAKGEQAKWREAKGMIDLG